MNPIFIKITAFLLVFYYGIVVLAENLTSYGLINNNRKFISNYDI